MLENNIFSAKVDAAFYLFTYILFPILFIVVGLYTTEDNAPLTYWYLTILCNAICCFHDCVNRWDATIPKRNKKLFRMNICILIIIVYTIVEIFLSINEIVMRFDYILFLYCVSIYISICDIFMLFESETT